jgi:hypothetical protein
MPPKAKKPVKEDPELKVITRDNRLPYRFVSIPTLVSYGYKWDGIYIRASPGKGLGLFIDKLEGGLLVPYGGIWISPEEHSYLKKCRRPSGLANYVMEGIDKGTFLDGHPRHCSENYTWPGVYINEPTSGSSEKFNARLVFLLLEDYPDIPEYPGIVNKGKYAAFIEVLVTAPVPREPVELFCYYSPQFRHKGKPLSRSYDIKDHNLLSNWAPPHVRVNVSPGDWYSSVAPADWYLTHYARSSTTRASNARAEEIGEMQDADLALCRRSRPSPGYVPKSREGARLPHNKLKSKRVLKRKASFL